MKNLCRFHFLALFFLLFALHSWAAAQQTQPQQAQAPQQKQQPAPITLEKVAGNIYEVKGGSGANGGVFIGEKEVLVIDAKMSEDSARQIIAEIQKISPNPVGYIVLTHSDGDHVNGLPGFPTGLKIIAHEETKRYMDEAFKEEKLRAYLPQVTFAEKYDLKLGNQVAKLFYFGPAHTSGDAVVYFPEEKVIFMGDLLFIGRDPLIHRHKNGSSFGLVKTIKAVLALDAEVFLSGHADRATRGDVEAMVKSLEEKQAQIKTMIAEGKSLEEIKKFYKIEDRPAQPGRTRFMSLPEVIYLELTEKK